MTAMHEKRKIGIRLKKLTARLERHFGIPKMNPRAVSPLTVLIATVLSQNTNDNNSFKAYCNLRGYSRSWGEIAELTKNDLMRLIAPAGLAGQKAETILLILRLVVVDKSLLLTTLNLAGQSDSEILSLLTAIRGVGMKTAACVLLFSLRRNVCPVDTHVHRILNRMGIISTKAPDSTFEAIQNHVPPDKAYSLHTNLIKLGREFCIASGPVCPACPVHRFCEYKNKTELNRNRSTRKTILLLDSL